MELSKFILEQSPLAVVIAHIRLAQTPEIESRVDVLRQRFKKIGLPIVDEQRQANLVVSSRQPVVTKARSSWSFLDPAQSRGAAITSTSCTYFSNSYQNFESFIRELNPIVESIVEVSEGAYFSSIGLRYLNIFRADVVPSNFLQEGLKGMSVEGINTGHFHHEYAFWCTTEDGNLVVRCKLDHGNKVPDDLGFAARVCPPKFANEVNVYLLDIYENSKTIRPQAELAVDAVGQYTSRQHENIDRAFLNCVTDEALRAWGKRDKLPTG